MKKMVFTSLIIASLLVFQVNLFARGSSSGQSKETLLRVTNTLPESHPMNKALAQMSKNVLMRTDNKVKIDLFPNSQLGGNVEMVEGVQLGTIDMANQFAGVYANYVPEMEVLSLAFLFENEEHLYRALDGKVGQILAEKLREKGFEPLGYFYGGARSLMNNSQPINSPKDLKGLKIRTIPSEITLKGINLMGAIATPMGQAEVYSALEQGVLDGWENSPITLYTLKLYEVTKYVSWTKHFMTPDLLAISGKTLAKLSAEEQKIIKEEAANAIALERKFWGSDADMAIEKLKEEGVVFNDVADVAAFQNATRPLWNEYEQKYQNGIIAEIDALRK